MGKRLFVTLVLVISVGMMTACGAATEGPQESVNEEPVEDTVEKDSEEEKAVDADQLEEVNEPNGSEEEIKECNIELYNGEFGILTLTAITSFGYSFDYVNTSSTDYSLYSQFMTVDGVQFNDAWISEDLFYGGIADNVSAGMKYSTGFYIPDNNMDPSVITGQIQVCEYPSGNVLGTIAFKEGFKGIDPDSLEVHGQKLYEGEFGRLTLSGVTEEGFYFVYENTSDMDYALYSEFMTVDGEQFNDEWIDEETFYGGIINNVSSGMMFQCIFRIPNNNVDAKEISGQIQVCEYPEGTVLGNITFDTTVKLY